MRKTKTKLIAYLFLGLLAFAVPFSHAAADGVVKMQDANEFLKSKTIGYKLDIDLKNAGQLINCGTSLCNLNGNKCLRKENKHRGRWRSVWRNTVATLEVASGAAATAGSAIVGGAATAASAVFTGGVAAVGTGAATVAAVGASSAVVADGIGRYQKTYAFEYICVPDNEVSNYTSDGWEDAGRNEGNVEYREERKSGDVNVKEYEVTKCFNAKNTSDGQIAQYCYEIIGNEVVVKAATSKRNICEVVPVKWYNNRECRFCSLLGTAFSAGDRVIETAKVSFSLSFAMVIVIGLAIWVAFKTLVFVSSMTKQDAAKYITEIIKQGYKFMIAFFALIYYDDLFIFIIRPLLVAGLEFGTALVDVGTIEERFDVNNLAELFAKTDLPNDYKQNLGNSYLTVDVYAKLEHFAYSVNAQYSLMQTVGQVLMCIGKKYIIGKLGGGTWYFGLGFACIIYGIILSAMGFLLCIAFVFYIFDAVIQIGLVGGLLPFLVASWPFKITSKYTSTGFKMLLNSIFNFMMLGLVARVTLMLIDKGIALNSNGESKDQGFGPLIEALNNLDAEALKLIVNVLSVGFLILLFACLLGFLLLGRVSELTDRFASGGMKAVAPSIATSAASTIKGAATKLAEPTTKAAGRWASDKVSSGIQSLTRGKDKDQEGSDDKKGGDKKPPTRVGG